MGVIVGSDGDARVPEQVRPLLPALLPETTEPAPKGRIRAQNVEATTGIEPVYAVLQTARTTLRYPRLSVIPVR
jgi:hypothetical protein